MLSSITGSGAVVSIISLDSSPAPLPPSSFERETQLVLSVLGNTDLIVEMKSGSYHTCALTASGEVWCVGRNDYGQLGIGNTGWHNLQ